MSYARYAVGIGIRAAAVALAAFAAIQFFSVYRLPTAATLALILGALVLVDLARFVYKFDQLLERFVHSLGAGEFERLSLTEKTHGFSRLRSAIEKATDAFRASRNVQQGRIDYLQTLVDTVSVALLVVRPDGSISLENRASRKFTDVGEKNLERIFGMDAALQLAKMQPGERCIVRLSNTQRTLVSTASFSTGGMRYQVFAVQDVDSELGAVEVKAWRDLVKILAHEMMNSLTPISSLAQSLGARFQDSTPNRSLEELPASEMQAAIDAIARRSIGLMNFVDRYRKMAEFPVAQLRVVNLGELIQRLDHLMRSTLLEKRIAYTSFVAPECTVVFADIDLLEQALINIVHNAVDALTNTSEPSISVMCNLRNNSVAIDITDNGHGIDVGSLDRIFIPFFTTKPGGSGIGLTLVKQIMLAHDGQVEVAQSQPHGTVITLSIPARKHTLLLE